MANSFNFDVGDILHEVKEQRYQRQTREKYYNMDIQDIKELAKNNSKKIDPKETAIMLEIYQELAIQNKKNEKRLTKLM